MLWPGPSLYGIRGSLKVFVDLEAVISGVGDDDLPVDGGRDALRSVEGTGQGVDERQERTLRIKNLDPGVAPVGHDDVVLE